MRLRFWIVAVAFSTAAFISSASAARPDFDSIRAQQVEVRAEVERQGGRYEALSPQQRTALLSRQDELLKLIDGKRDETELAEEERRAVSEALGWIQNALARAEDDRRVCELRKILGSNRKERICMTVRQQREQREAARDQLSSGSCSNCGSR